MKTLYTFSVDKTVNVEKTETKEDGTKVVTTVKEKTPLQFSIKKPSRAETDEADIFRAATLHELIRKGVMPQAVLAKTYENEGGFLSDNELEYDLSLRRQLFERSEELKNLKVNEQDNKVAIDATLKEIFKLQNSIIDFQQSQNSFYTDTAEFKAKTKFVEYLLVFLTYHSPKNDGKLEQYFKGNSFNEKSRALEALEEENDEVYLQVRDKVLFVISVYMQLGNSVKQEDIDKLLLPPAEEVPAVTAAT